MNEILSDEQQRRADGHTILSEPISSIDLMERASKEFVKAIIPYIHGKQTIHVFCGTGNNGGDGLAVARLLHEKGCNVHTYLVMYSNQLSADAQLNLARLSDVHMVSEESQIPVIHHEHVVVDGLFGSGLTRPVVGLAASVISAINFSMARVLSIDVPSGLPCDELPFSEGAVVRAHFTATFERPKLTFFLPESEPYMLDWRVIPIGLNQQFIEEQPCEHYYLSEDIFQCKLLPRKRFSHKGTYGHGLLLAGSKGKMGAAVLAAKAALRSGIGLLTTHVPKCGYTIMQTSVPEAMCSVDRAEEQLTELPEIHNISAIACGPGMGVSEQTAMVLDELFQKNTLPLVLDADALNTLAEYPNLLNRLPENTILTPHPKEFERLVGKTANSLDRLERLKAFSRKNHVVTVLKDAVTAVCLPSGRVYFNTTGNPGMATGGSGDVLTGMVLGLLAQGYSSENAALIAVYFHGRAGDHAAQLVGENAVIASDIVESIRIKV